MVRIISNLLFYLYLILNFIIFRRNSPIRVDQRKENFDKSQRVLSKFRYVVLLLAVILEIYLKNYTSAMIDSILLLFNAIYDVRAPYWR